MWLVELIGNDSLPAVIDVNVSHRLLARLVQLRQCLQRCPAIALRLHRQPPISFGGFKILAHVDGGASGKFREHAIQRDCLRCEHPAGHGEIAALGLPACRTDIFGTVRDAWLFR